MFRRLHESKDYVCLIFEDKEYRVPAQITVAAALMNEGILVFCSSVVSGQPRAPYCMMGVCFECLLEIDGQPNQQACMIEVREGMSIRKQSRVPGQEE